MKIFSLNYMKVSSLPTEENPIIDLICFRSQQAKQKKQR